MFCVNKPVAEMFLLLPKQIDVTNKNKLGLSCAKLRAT